MTPAAAFFDVDRTLVVGTSLESCFLRVAMERGALHRFALLRNLPAGLRALGLLPSAAGKPFPVPDHLPFLTRLRYAFFSGNKAYLEGLSLNRCRALAQATFQQEVRPRLGERGESLVEQHRQAGRLVVLLSGTLDFLGEPVRRYLEADALLAAQPEVRAGRLTGRLAGRHPYGEHKRTMLLRFANERGIDLQASFAYADHHTDLPFLEAVGHPVAVNADPLLAAIAQERGWVAERF